MSNKRKQSKKIDLRSIGTARVNSAPSYQQRPITPKDHTNSRSVNNVSKTQPIHANVPKSSISASKHPAPQAEKKVAKKEVVASASNGINNSKVNILNDSNLDWLDEMTDELKGKAPNKPKMSKPTLKKEAKPKTNAETTQININISVPKLPNLKKVKLPKKSAISSRIPKDKFKILANKVKSVARKPNRKQIVYIISAFACLAVVAVGITQYLGKNNANTPQVSGEAEQKKPDFTLIMPGGKINGKIAYNSEKKVASIQSQIGDNPVIISQQPIPAGFKPDPAGETAQLAKEMNANDKLEGNGFTAHLGQSIKGPQTVVFTKSGTLVFIKSTETIPKEQWAEFLKTFK